MKNKTKLKKKVFSLMSLNIKIKSYDESAKTWYIQFWVITVFTVPFVADHYLTSSFVSAIGVMLYILL